MVSDRPAPGAGRNRPHRPHQRAAVRRVVQASPPQPADRQSPSRSSPERDTEVERLVAQVALVCPSSALQLRRELTAVAPPHQPTAHRRPATGGSITRIDVAQQAQRLASSTSTARGAGAWLVDPQLWFVTEDAAASVAAPPREAAPEPDLPLAPPMVETESPVPPLGPPVETRSEAPAHDDTPYGDAPTSRGKTSRGNGPLPNASQPEVPLPPSEQWRGPELPSPAGEAQTAPAANLGSSGQPVAPRPAEAYPDSLLLEVPPAAAKRPPAFAAPVVPPLTPPPPPPVVDSSESTVPAPVQVAPDRRVPERRVPEGLPAFAPPAPPAPRPKQ